MSKLPQADRKALFSRLFGRNIARLREVVAAELIHLRIGPNSLTIVGLLTTVAAAVCLAFGAGDKVGSPTSPGFGWYGFAAALLIIFASAFDILDGAVARNSNHITKVGALLDSCCDRVADAAIFTGIMMYYVRHPEIKHHQLFALATIIALANAQIISYIKARAENFIDRCPVGYWQRGERVAGILIGLFSGHIGTVMVMLATLSAFTVLRRLIFACRQVKRSETNAPPLDPRAPQTGIMRLALWRHPRMSLPYDIVTAANIALILFIDLQRCT